ncbi:hypothetical protein ACHAWF_000215, partial [Thalassiosira exigua]
EVRTIEGTLTSALAKLYGKVNPGQIKIEYCSRTDAGVHAVSLITQFYCAPNVEDGASSGDKSAARPLTLPFNWDLSKLVFVLNRILPPDIRVLAALPTTNGGRVSFQPSLRTLSKTYVYRFAIGFFHGSLETKYMWHLNGSSARAVSMSSK